MKNYLILGVLFLATVGCYKSLDIEPNTKTTTSTFTRVDDFGFEFHQQYDITGYCPGFSDEIVVGAVNFISPNLVYTGSATQGGQSVTYSIDNLQLTINTPLDTVVFNWNEDSLHFKAIQDDCQFMIYL